MFLYDSNQHLTHGVSVANLRSLLSNLKDGDVLVPDNVRNLAVIRDSVHVGYIDLGDEECVRMKTELKP